MTLTAKHLDEMILDLLNREKHWVEKYPELSFELCLEKQVTKEGWIRFIEMAMGYRNPITGEWWKKTSPQKQNYARRMAEHTWKWVKP